MSDEKPEAGSECSIGQSASTGGLERKLSDAAALMAVAREAGIAVQADAFGRGTFLFSDVEVLRRILGAARRGAACEEREACAVFAEGSTAYTQFQTVEHYKMAATIAAAIRERSNVELRGAEQASLAERPSRTPGSASLPPCED